MNGFASIRRSAVLAFAAVPGWLSLAPALPAVTLDLGDPELAAALRRVPVAGRVSLLVELPGSEAPAVLELERFRVFAPGARIVVHSEDGSRQLPPPDRADFKGALAGRPDSLSVVSITAAGELRGWISTEGRWLELAGSAAGGPVWREADLAGLDAMADGRCAAGDLDPIPRLVRRGAANDARVGIGVQYAVDLAIDTDWELFQTFGTEPDATAYVADLVAAASAIYERDVSTLLQLSLVVLWTTPADPWTVQDDLLEALYELGDHWHANHAETERTLAHLVSGKGTLGGGIAYGGVLCSPDIFVNGHWAGGYAVSGGMAASGEFRDTFIFSHELGHNFDSRHTHCYNGMPLPPDPEIDQCRSGETTGGGHVCYAGPETVPGDGGSIMSYCHLQPGGYGNINLWLGREGHYGVGSERVPEKMLQHVEEVAACLPAVPGIFADGFESGDTSAWSSTIP